MISREKEEYRYRIIFEKDIRKRVKLSYFSMEDVMNLTEDELKKEDKLKYLISLEKFIKLKPFSEAYFDIENLPNEFTDMDVSYVDLVVIHEWNQDNKVKQTIYMETEKERTSSFVLDNLHPNTFWDFAWEVMPYVSMVINNGNIIADYTKTYHLIRTYEDGDVIFGCQGLSREYLRKNQEAKTITV